MIELYVLDVPEFRPVIGEATSQADRSQKVGDYFRFLSEGPLSISRKSAQARRAVWFSAIGALRNGKVTQFDSDTLHIEPD
jgi:hypothetical protein